MERDKKLDLTKEELIEKINNERETFREANRYREQHKMDLANAVRRSADLLIARIVQAYGTLEGDEYVLDIPKPGAPKGHFWATKVETPTEDTYRLRAKLIKIPEMDAFEGRNKYADVVNTNEKQQGG